MRSSGVAFAAAREEDRRRDALLQHSIMNMQSNDTFHILCMLPHLSMDAAGEDVDETLGRMGFTCADFVPRRFLRLIYI